jgi:small ligand-binding sensory domain FIST
MKWASSIQNSASLEKCVRMALDEVKTELGKEPMDLAFLFVSSAYRSELVDLWPVIRNEFKSKFVIGCTGGGIIGGGREIEFKPAVSLIAASLPGVNLYPFLIQQENLPDADQAPKAWRELVKAPADEKPSFILFSDPFSLDSDALVRGLDYAYPASIKTGGLASGGTNPNENLLFLNDKITSKGAVGLALSGNISIEAVVAQGCRPIGKALPISASDENILMGLDGQPPMDYIQKLYHELSPIDQELLQTSLFLGIAMDSFNAEPKQGDFLIRNIIGLDQDKGFLAIGAGLRNGQLVQFHLRDAETSKEDLQLMLKKSLSAKQKKYQVDASGGGAVLFSCLGRGEKLYGKPDHDSKLIKEVLGDIPVGGFFCNGEIGPVGGKTYLHGYTSSIALITSGTTGELNTPK